jgi:hypothetical protein
MAFHLSKPIMPLLGIAMGAMVLSVAAQQSGQSIIFSSPQNDDIQSVTPSLVQPALPSSLPSAMQAPVSPFSYNNIPENFATLPSPQANSAQQQRMKKMLDDRKNWTLMTPEEMFGVTTTGKPLERDALGHEKNQTQLERYLDRENRAPTGRTNSWQADRPNSPWDMSHAQGRTTPFDLQRNETVDASQNFNRLFNGQQSSDVPANRNGTVSWDTFNPPTPQAPVKPNLEQQAAMERFRQLLQPSPALGMEPSLKDGFSPASKPIVDPNITRPDFVVNPSGASFTPLVSGLGKPAGLTPLPGVSTTHLSPPAVTPSWAPAPPPWTSQAPQPFATPQWKF